MHPQGIMEVRPPIGCFPLMNCRSSCAQVNLLSMSLYTSIYIYWCIVTALYLTPKVPNTMHVTLFILLLLFFFTNLFLGSYHYDDGGPLWRQQWMRRGGIVTKMVAWLAQSRR